MDRVSLGVLSKKVTSSLVNEVVESCGVKEQRRRRLPARVVVLFVLAMCLFTSCGYEEVMRRLVSGLPRWRDWPIPNKSSITRARERLGWEVMQRLFQRLSITGDADDLPGVTWRSRRLMALDGTLWSVAETADNLTLGQPSGGPRSSVGSYPLIRMMALAECGSRRITDVEFGRYLDGETDVALPLARSLTSDMLVIADRGLHSRALFGAWTATGAGFLVRVPTQVGRRALEILPDGTYLTKYGHWSDGSTKLRSKPLKLRVIEYSINDGDVIRLLTNLTDPDTAPAEELAFLYSQRWEIETAFADLKTRQRGRDTILRSGNQYGLRQELYAHLIIYNLTRNLIVDSAHHKHLNPDKISFTRALQLVRRSITEQAGFSPRRLRTALTHATTELTQRLLPIRRHRSTPRTRKRAYHRWANTGRPQATRHNAEPPTITIHTRHA